MFKLIKKNKIPVGFVLQIKENYYTKNLTFIVNLYSVAGVLFNPGISWFIWTKSNIPWSGMEIGRLTLRK